MSILREVDRYLEHKDKGELDRKARSSHHPSGFSKCLRQMYYEWTREPVSNYRAATDIWRMNVGKWIHKGFADILKEMYGDKVKDEVEIFFSDPSLKYPVHGYMDNVIEIDGIYIGIELKTSFGRGIVAIQKDGKPRVEDEAQTKVYLSCSDFIKGFCLPYLGRDSFYRTEFEITMTEDEKESFRKKIIAKFKRLEEAVSEHKLPDRDFKAVVKDCEIKDEIQHKGVKYRSDWQCLYCVYRDTCYAEEIKGGGICL